MELLKIQKQKSKITVRVLIFIHFSFYRSLSWPTTDLTNENNTEYLDAKAIASMHILNRLSLGLKKEPKLLGYDSLSSYLLIRFSLLRDDFITVINTFKQIILSLCYLWRLEHWEWRWCYFVVLDYSRELEGWLMSQILYFIILGTVIQINKRTGMWR